MILEVTTMLAILEIAAIVFEIVLVVDALSKASQRVGIYGQGAGGGGRTEPSESRGAAGKQMGLAAPRSS